MPGESVLLIEDSPAERDIAQNALEDAGYRVISAANAAAALTYPEIKDVNLIVMDGELDGVDGYETTRLLRQQASTHPIPVLMLIPEGSVGTRTNLSIGGANGYLIKPYEAVKLIKKAGNLIDEQYLDDLARQYLSDSADKLMSELANKHIKDAVERKTQIIVERCIQNVSTVVDQRAREEVDARVTELTAEKEQELVKLTVREVAQSMVEKLAERKVTEAIDATLPEQAERSVKRIVDQTLPSTIRERLKESMNNVLPREIQVRLQKAAEKMVPELSQQLIQTVEAVSNKTVPRLSRELLPEIADRQFKLAAGEQIPKLVADLVGRELEKQVFDKVQPAIRSARRSLRTTIIVWNTILTLMVVGGLGGLIYLLFFTPS
jgi:CheY-like chemotaxis protein